MDKDKDKEMDGKLPYEKPRLRIISLLAEEVLSVGCKHTFGSPAGRAGHGCGFASCSVTLGS